MTGLEGQRFHGVAKPTVRTRGTYNKNASHHGCTDKQKIRVTPKNRKTGHIKIGCNLRDMLLAAGQVGKGQALVVSCPCHGADLCVKQIQCSHGC